MRILLATALGVACSGVCVFGQVAQSRPQPFSGNYSLEGRIATKTRQAVAAARVVLSSMESPNGQTTFSDDDGRFFFFELRPGAYQLMVSASGFKTLNKDVDLNFGSQNLTLVLQPLEQTPEPTGGGTVSADILSLPKSCVQKYEKGREALRKGDDAGAVRNFQAALKEREFAAGFGALGIAYVGLRQAKKAKESFERCLALSDSWGEAHLGLGLLANDAGHYEEAETHLARARALLPEEWRVDYELGRSHYHRDQLAAAEQDLLRAHQSGSDFGSLHLLLANVYAMTDRLAEAAAEMREFLQSNPGSKLAPQVREKVKLLEAELSKPGQ